MWSELKFLAETRAVKPQDARCDCGHPHSDVVAFEDGWWHTCRECRHEWVAWNPVESNRNRGMRDDYGRFKAHHRSQPER